MINREKNMLIAIKFINLNPNNIQYKMIQPQLKMKLTIGDLLSYFDNIKCHNNRV